MPYTKIPYDTPWDYVKSDPTDFQLFLAIIFGKKVVLETGAVIVTGYVWRYTFYQARKIWKEND